MVGIEWLIKSETGGRYNPSKIEGDFIETGVWRGGATIFMRAILKAYDIKDRLIFVADSFEGLPKQSGKYF